MPGRLCPVCGHFELELIPGYGKKPDVYVCSFCAAQVPVEEANAPLTRDTVQRFPTGSDAEGSDTLASFLERKKQ